MDVNLIQIISIIIMKKNKKTNGKTSSVNYEFQIILHDLNWLNWINQLNLIVCMDKEFRIR